MIDATLKAIGEKAPPLPAHILSEMHSQANGEKKQQVKYEQSPAPQITEQKPSMPFGISATPSTPPTEQYPNDATHNANTIPTPPKHGGIGAAS